MDNSVKVEKINIVYCNCGTVGIWLCSDSLGRMLPVSLFIDSSRSIPKTSRVYLWEIHQMVLSNAKARIGTRKICPESFFISVLNSFSVCAKPCRFSLRVDALMLIMRSYHYIAFIWQKISRLRKTVLHKIPPPTYSEMTISQCDVSPMSQFLIA